MRTPADLIPANDLSRLLPNWRGDKRARNLAPSTIKSYIGSAELLSAYLLTKG